MDIGEGNHDLVFLVDFEALLQTLTRYLSTNCFALQQPQTQSKVKNEDRYIMFTREGLRVVGLEHGTKGEWHKELQRLPKLFGKYV